jgi:hypothetical protein
LGFGAVFLLAFAGGLAGPYSLRPKLVTAPGITERIQRLRIGSVLMGVVAWLTVISGTWIADVVHEWPRHAPKAEACAHLLPLSVVSGIAPTRPQRGASVRNVKPGVKVPRSTSHKTAFFA